MNPANPDPETSGSDPPAVRRKRRWLIKILPTLFFFCLVAVIGLLAGRIKTEGEVLEARKRETVQEVPRINVVTLTASPSLMRDRINLPGTTEPWIYLTVVAEVRGQVVQKRVTEGQRVQTGQILAEVDARDYENTYRSAKASYETARAAQDRLRKLQKGQLTTRSQLDDARALVENTRAAMDTAALNLERCTIRAPMSGEVNRVAVEVGHYLNTGDTVAEILQMDRLKVRVGIPESDVDAVRRLDTFQVTIDALGGRTFTARKRFLSNTADPMARLYGLELALDNPDRLILPDMFVRVEIIKRRIDDGLAVPLYAIINRDQRNLVYVVENGTARERPVTLGLQDGWRVQIRDGIAAGDRVIVVGHRGVAEDQPVNVVRNVDAIQDLPL